VSHLAADGPSINALVDELLQRYTVLEKVKAKGLKTIDAPAVEVMPQLAAIEQNYPWIERGPPCVPVGSLMGGSSLTHNHTVWY
jgi:hypothetical protein